MLTTTFDYLTTPLRRDPVERPPAWREFPSHLSRAELQLAAVRLGVTHYKSPVSGLVVGENPSESSSHGFPLFPWPAPASAARLVAMSEITPGEYLGGLYRRNLVDDYWWRMCDARTRAREMVTALFDLRRDLRVILCGAKVAKCFGLAPDYWQVVELESRQRAVVIPHPSGLNRIYNDRACRRKTGAWVRWAALGEDLPR